MHPTALAEQVDRKTPCSMLAVREGERDFEFHRGAARVRMPTTAAERDYYIVHVTNMIVRNQIAPEFWAQFFTDVSDRNRGRSIVVRIEDPDLGICRLDDGVPLMSIAFDEIGKGNDIVISIGRESVEWTHSINAPVQVVDVRNEDGSEKEVVLVDESATTTRLIFVD